LEIKENEKAATSLIQDLNRLRASTKIPSSRSPLVRLVDVGQASEQETRRLYSKAKKSVRVFSRAFEYLPKVIEGLASAGKRGVTLRFILLDPSKLPSVSVDVQKKMIELLRSKVPSAQIGFSNDVPLRGTIIDPGLEGAAIFLAEERGVPLFVREAAVTENPGVVRGLGKLFDLMWRTLLPSSILSAERLD